MEREKERKEGRNESKGQWRKQNRWKRNLENKKKTGKEGRMVGVRKKKIEEGEGRGKGNQGKECICQIIAEQHCTVNPN